MPEMKFYHCIRSRILTSLQNLYLHVWKNCELDKILTSELNLESLKLELFDYLSHPNRVVIARYLTTSTTLKAFDLHSNTDIKIF